MTQSFLFDLGNVMVTFDFSKFYLRLRDHGAQFDAAAEHEHQHLRDAFESGRIDATAFIRASSELLRFPGDAEVFRTCWTEIFALNAPMQAFVRTLHSQGRPLYILSNTNSLHLDYLRSRFDFFRFFRGGVYSHLAGSLKPEEGIFRTAMAELGLLPASTFYIDDRPDNVETGRRLGFVTHCYDSSRHQAFEDLVLSTPPGPTPHQTA